MELSKKERNKRIFHIALTAAIMVFIFLQSAMPDYASAQESGFFVNVAESIMNAITGKQLDLENLSFVIRKLAHFTEYAIFGCSLLLTVGDLVRSFPSKGDGEEADSSNGGGEETNSSNGNEIRLSVMAGLISWGIGSIYAVTDEFHQYFVPGRSCEVRDMLLDSLGVATGVVIFSLIVYSRKKKRNPEKGDRTKE